MPVLSGRVLVAFVLSLGTLAWLLLSNRSQPVRDLPVGQSSPVQVHDDGSKDATSAVRALGRTMSALAERIERLEMAGEGKGETSVPEEEEPPTPEEMEEQIAAQKTETVRRLQVIDGSFRNEPRDARWSSQMRDAIHNVFARGNFSGTHILDMDCKSSLCRIQVEHDSQQSSTDFERLPREFEGNYYIQHLDPDDQGRSQTIAFLVRKGHEQENALYEIMYATSNL